MVIPSTGHGKPAGALPWINGRMATWVLGVPTRCATCGPHVRRSPPTMLRLSAEQSGLQAKCIPQLRNVEASIALVPLGIAERNSVAIPPRPKRVKRSVCG